jgi:hypothetical protein
MCLYHAYAFVPHPTNTGRRSPCPQLPPLLSNLLSNRWLPFAASAQPLLWHGTRLTGVYRLHKQFEQPPNRICRLDPEGALRLTGLPTAKKMQALTPESSPTSVLQRPDSAPRSPYGASSGVLGPPLYPHAACRGGE